MSYKRTRSAIFEKDPDVLPFFSIHPKTKVGMILRILLFVFVALSMILMLLASNGLMFIWLYNLYYLIYLVPAFIACALIILALFKRMRSTFTKILVPGLLGFFAISILTTLFSTMSGFYSLSITPKSMMKVDDHSVVFMRACDSLPHEETESAEEAALIRYRRQMKRFTARVPAAYEGESYTIEGEILIPEGAEYLIKASWEDENELRLYIASDNSGMGKGEIKVKFAPGETTPASPDSTENMHLESIEESPKQTHKSYLYSETSYIDMNAESFLEVDEMQLRQVYTAYPVSLRMFAHSFTRVDGVIVLEPYSDLRIQCEWAEGEDEVLVIHPAEGSEGANGEIRIYFNEKVNKAEEEA